MTTNKELGYYQATYICMNCRSEINVKIDFGKSIHSYSTDKEMVKNGYALQSPECQYCGCFHWSSGRKPA